MEPLRFASGHTATLDPLFADIAKAIGAMLHRPVTILKDIPWEERYQRLDAGQLEVAWICGGPYVRRQAADPTAVTLLAAPVWRGERYDAQPVYFADVIVRQDRPWQRFADLRGALWVYNEPGSLSGYDAMRYFLAQQGYTWDFFGGQIASGGHLRSLQMVLAGAADVTAIDSVILAEQLRRRPEIAPLIHPIASIGPLPSMPWVAARTVEPHLRAELSAILCTLHQTQPMLLAEGPLAHFAPVVDADYAPIRTILGLP